MVGTHSLGFLLALVAPQVLGALGFPWVQVFQLCHHYLGDLEGPRMEIDLTFFINVKIICNQMCPLCVISMHSLSISSSQL